MRHSVIPAVVLALLFVRSSPAEDWPEFRGPTGQGLVRGTMPTAWSPTQNVVWKQPIAGKGWSSPVVVGGKIYLTTAVPVEANGDHSLRALCLDAASGKSVWDQEIFVQSGKNPPRVHAKNSHASPTPLVYDGRVYVHFGHQGTACLDLTGKVLWKHIEKYTPVHGNGGSPVLVDGLLIYSCDGADNPRVVALDAQSGKVRWTAKRAGDPFKKFSFHTPLCISVNGKKQVISQGADELSALDPVTGKEIWKVRYEGYSVIPRPVFGHGMIFLSTGYDSPSLLAIRADGKGDVTETHIAWQNRKGAPHTPSPLLVGDELYVVSDRGVASCLDAKTGKVHWEERLTGGFSASPVFGDGKVYFTSEEGVTTVAKAGTKYERLATNDMKERTLASFAAVDGALFLRTEKSLYRIEGK